MWVNPDPPAVPKLRFSWPHGGQNFTFDLGGSLRFGEYAGQMFYAEVKAYASPSDLGTHYSEFLAKCYVAYLDKPTICDNFMWLSWSPHSITQWPNLMTAQYVRTHVLNHHERVFGTTTKADAESLIDEEALSEVAKRLWLIVLSDKQETLVMSREHRGLIDKYEIEQGR